MNRSAKTKQMMAPQRMHEQAISTGANQPLLPPTMEPGSGFEVSGVATSYRVRNDNNQTVLPGAFDELLRKAQTIPLLFHHKHELKAGEVFSFESRKNCLFVKARLDEGTPVGRDARRLIEAKLLDSLSSTIIYSKKANEEDEFGHRTIRTVAEVEEISLVLMPADPLSLLATAEKEQRETLYADYKERLYRFWAVERKLETRAIYELVYNEWKRVILISRYQSKIF